MYVVVIAILSLVLAFPSPPLRWLRAPDAVVTAVCVATLLPIVIALLTQRRTLALLDRAPDDPSIAQAAYGRGMSIVQFTLLGAHGLILVATRWLPLCERVPGVENLPLLGGAIAIVPFLLSLLLVWVAIFPADRAIRQIALEVHLFRGRPVHPVWTLPQFLAFNFRHQVLFILIPMLAILAARDVIVLNRKELQQLSPHPFLPDLLLGLMACAVAVVAPLVLRWVWQVRPLPSGPLRDQLESLCRRLRMRCAQILVWQSGGMVVNAAVMGVVAPLRYVLISDAMLEQLDDRKIEAVFGHEAGHVKRGHILFFLLFAFISGCAVSVLSAYSRTWSRDAYSWITLAVGVVLVLKWSVLFGFISRRFERQADLFGARTLALAEGPCGQPCALHDGSGASRSPLSGPICRSAANVFSDTLNDVAMLNGICPEAPSWRHGSIASRSRVMQTYAQDPAQVARFERGITIIKVLILAGACAAGLWAVVAMRLWEVLPIGRVLGWVGAT